MYTEEPISYSSEQCRGSIDAIQDAMYVLNGKWKMPLVAAMANGALRFGELQKLLDGITARVLSSELRELELNELVERKVYPTVPATVTYELTAYSRSLGPVLERLRQWGEDHKQHIIESRRRDRLASATPSPSAASAGAAASSAARTKEKN